MNFRFAYRLRTYISSNSNLPWMELKANTLHTSNTPTLTAGNFKVFGHGIHILRLVRPITFMKMVLMKC